MLFACTPRELVAHILETTSFSGNNGVTLKEMWSIVSHKFELPTLDDFQKQVVWQWLFFYKSKGQPLDVIIIKDGVPITILPKYQSVIDSIGSDTNLRIVPTPDTQWKYLTGFGNSKKLKQQLGEYPFQLLCEISKYGSNGIHSPDLCRATGQDPRSLPLRLKKLEELGLIKRKNVYNEKTSQHTSLCVHFKFANDEITSIASDLNSDFETSRNVHKLKHYIVNAVKSAPNKLRGFKDLKCELNLDKSQSSSKFFRGIVEFLHTHGYVERLMVKDTNDHLVYCIKYIRDIPKGSDEISDYVDFFNPSPDDLAQDNEVESFEIPAINNFFPVTNQIFEYISKCGKPGITSMELARNLTGVSDYRPFVKLFDLITTYNIDGDKLSPLGLDFDILNNLAIGRAYDFEGKYKFYRYFRIGDEARSVVKRIELKMETSQMSLEDINQKLYTPLSKTPKGSMVNARKRKVSHTNGNGLKRSKVEKHQESLKATPGSSKLLPVESLPLPSATPADKVDSSVTPSTIYEMEPIIPKDGHTSSVRKRNSSLTPKANSNLSLKANRRRMVLIEIIKELGGVTYTTTKLCRLIDEKLGNFTITDKKTLARDVSVLISDKVLEARTIPLIRSGQEVSRKLLILNDPKWRPTDTQIDEMKSKCMEDNGTKLSFTIKRRVIEDKVTLYKSSGTANRTKDPHQQEPNNTSDAKSKHKKLIGKENSFSGGIKEHAEADNKDLLSSFLTHNQRRKRKIVKKKETVENEKSSNNRKYRTAIRFDDTDATTLFKAVVVSKTFKKGLIDFDQIATLFRGISAREIKQKWTVVRRQVGGLSAVTKGTEAFEYIVMKGIDDGLVSASDLENINLEFFLDLWKDADNSVFDIIDTNPLYSSVEDNHLEYNRSESSDHPLDLYEQLEDHSMRQKEAILSGTTFYELEEPELIIKSHDHLRTILKAIFSTREEDFSSNQVTRLLSSYKDEDIQDATSGLIKDKEISYYQQDDTSTRFVTTDKFQNTFILKIFSPRFFHLANHFQEGINSLAETSRGMIVSEGITGGLMASLLQLIASGSVDIIRIDKSYTFRGYESRLIDKENLSCDVIVAGNKLNHNRAKKVPVPTGKACSHIWLDLNGNINSEIWVKVLITVLYFIAFRPGIPGQNIHYKLQAVLGQDDFTSVMTWLIDSHCIVKGKHDGYWLRPCWYSILG
ncbi:uncharacterized protein PRCAT00004837001 [Priceomyces carsonii]|uniref:uncharacterized protein n=1 Tax=Priceomyces carsonii TaxID=28549 RepID=UPI002EDB7EA6|nr:unnamed protein product [Priceomyces carsonii]